MGSLAGWICRVPGSSCTTETLDRHQIRSDTLLRLMTVTYVLFSLLFFQQEVCSVRSWLTLRNQTNTVRNNSSPTSEQSRRCDGYRYHYDDKHQASNSTVHAWKESALSCRMNVKKKVDVTLVIEAIQCTWYSNSTVREQIKLLPDSKVVHLTVVVSTLSEKHTDQCGYTPWIQGA